MPFSYEQLQDWDASLHLIHSLGRLTGDFILLALDEKHPTNYEHEDLDSILTTFIQRADGMPPSHQDQLWENYDEMLRAHGRLMTGRLDPKDWAEDVRLQGRSAGSLLQVSDRVDIDIDPSHDHFNRWVAHVGEIAGLKEAKRQILRGRFGIRGAAKRWEEIGNHLTPSRFAYLTSGDNPARVVFSSLTSMLRQY